MSLKLLDAQEYGGWKLLVTPKMYDAQLNELLWCLTAAVGVCEGHQLLGTAKMYDVELNEKA